MTGSARHLGVARNTVRAALRDEVAPKYEREGAGSAVDAFEPAIRRLLAVTPDMPATVVAERIGWTRGMTVLRDRVPSSARVTRLIAAGQLTLGASVGTQSGR